MNAILDTLSSDAAFTLGRVLLHTLWQAALLAAALWVVLKTLPADRAPWRYNAACLALAVLVLCAFITHAALTASPPAIEANTPTHLASPSVPDATTTITTTPSLTSTPTNTPSPSNTQRKTSYLPACLLALWALTAATLLLRTFTGILASRRLTRCESQPATLALQDQLYQLKKHMGIRPHVELLVSAAVGVPLVVGALCPAIVLPPALVAGLSPQQLRIVLAHELAHIRRHDTLINLLQRLIEALLFFNPAVWWISRQIRTEREACCDLSAADAVDGNRIHVARTLVEVLQQITTHRTANTSPHVPNVSVELGQPHQPHALSERIRRLVRPSTHSPSRLPLPSLAILLTLTIASLYGLFYSSQITVAAVNQILNPQQYVQETRQHIEQVQNQNPQPRLDENRQVIPEDLVTIGGVITTEDGKPIASPKLKINIRSERPTHGSTTGISVKPSTTDPAVAPFHQEHIAPGNIYIYTQADDYAPFIAPMVHVPPGASKTDFEIVLQRGFDLPIHVTDPNGHPIADVQLTNFTIYYGNIGHGIRLSPPLTNANGQTTLAHLSEHRISANIFHPGYERIKLETIPQPNKLWTIILTPAQPFQGVVLDRVTGHPIADTSVRIAAEEGHQSDPRSPSPSLASPLDTTNANGLFTLDTLKSHQPYTLWFEAPGYAPQLVLDIKPGQYKNIPFEVRLLPAITLHAHVIGTAQELAALPPKPQIRLNQSLQIKHDSSSGSSIKTTLDTTTHPASAVFEGLLFDGQANVSLGNATLQLADLRQAAQAGPVVLNLSPTPSVLPATRQVILTLRPPNGWPHPQGTLEVSYRKQHESRYLERSTHPIQNGQVTFEVPLDEGNHQFDVDLLHAPGYWLPLPEPGQPSHRHVAASDGPYEETLNLLPAGLISGQVLNDSGQPIPFAGLSLKEIQAPPQGRTDANWWNNQKADAQGRFVISPVPLGGIYQVVASHANLSRFAQAHGPHLTITADQPRPNTTLTVPRGTDITVQLVDPSDNPIPNTSVDLHLKASHGGHGWGPPQHTNGHGTTVFKGLNFNIPGATWTINIEPTNGLRGQSVELSANQPNLTIQLKPGVEIRGIVLDDATGQPLPNVELSLQIHADQRNTATYPSPIKTTTNPSGQFVFNGLEPNLTYQFTFESMHHAEPANIKRHPDGSIRGIAMSGSQVTPKPNQPNDPITLRVVVNPWER